MRDLRSISSRDWAIYVSLSLLLLVGAFVSAESALKLDPRLEFTAMSAFLAFGIVVENGWPHRHSIKFWCIVIVFLAIHFAILLYTIPIATTIPMLLFAPVSLLEAVIFIAALRRFGFASALLRKHPQPDLPVREYQPFFKTGAFVILLAAVLLLASLSLRSSLNSNAVAALAYVASLTAFSGIGIFVVGAARWFVKQFRLQ